MTIARFPFLPSSMLDHFWGNELMDRANSNFSSTNTSLPTVNIKDMENASLTVKGRHDVCIVPRAVAVVESMMAVTLCDFAMRAELIPRVIK